ncbi:MAG: serine hydrolase [Cyclobacteriaceae bacterium]
MHFKTAILSIIMLGFFAPSKGEPKNREDYIDSIYRDMSAFEKISKLVLVKPQKGTEIPASAGLFMDQPISALQDLDGRLVIVSLDDRLNPFDKALIDLPDLPLLATISEFELLTKYFAYFEKLCINAGIHQIILPNAESSSRAEKVLNHLVSLNPNFFLSETDIVFEAPKKKKEIISAFDQSAFVVINQDEATETNEKISKYAKKVLDKADCEERIKELLLKRASLNPTYQINKLPNQLAVGLTKGSVIPLQKEVSILPIQSDTICFITDQPYGSLANTLRKYAYVMTTVHDIAASNAPILIDNDSWVSNELLDDSRSIIFLGQMNRSLPYLDYLDAALIYQKPSAIYNYTLPQQIFGAASISGKLPDANTPFIGFSDASIAGNSLIGYAPSFMVGLDNTAQREIGDIMNEAIQSGGTPGAQLAIAVDGSIVFNQAYGYLTYDSLIATQKNTLYDLASLTKVTATLLAIMKLYEDGLIDLDAPISRWLPAYENSNKKDITVRALLSHNAGLRPYVPFWQRVLSADLLETFYYEDEEAEKADIRSYGTRPTPAMRDTLENWILKSPLLKFDSLPYYKYSDLGFMILHQIVESVTTVSMDTYLDSTFYRPLGLTRTAFNPLTKGVERFEIAPTEYDDYFRDELVWGEVHDRNAAIFGGVAGHAGLFSNAHDLIVILQTLLQGGTYGGQQLLQTSTIEYFNQRFYPNNRRALGWDKADKNLGNASRWSTDESFGHTGFTGTMVWCDPEYDLVFVFLSNRIYPNSSNYQLIKRNIRTRIQDVVYEALLAKWVK